MALGMMKIEDYGGPDSGPEDVQYEGWGMGVGDDTERSFYKDDFDDDLVDLQELANPLHELPDFAASRSRSPRRTT